MPPGGTYTYEYTVSQHGTYFYHTHDHADRQQAFGLYGALIIRPRNPDGEVRADLEQVVQLQEWLKREWLTYPAMVMEGGLPNYFTINGKAYPATDKIEMRVGQTMKLRFIGTNNNRTAHPRLTKHVRASPYFYTYSKVAFAKLYDRKTRLTAADLMNDRVVPFFDEHEIAVSRVLTDRGTEFCGKPEAHEYELYLAVENIDHTRTTARSPQTNGISERFHKTLLDEFYRVAFRKKLYR